jgi:hypothetical protein
MNVIPDGLAELVVRVPGGEQATPPGQGLFDMAHLEQPESKPISQVKELLGRLPLLSPFNPWVLCWLLFMLLVLIFMLCEMPVAIFFGQAFYSTYREYFAVTIIYLVCLFALLVNGLVFLSIGFFKEGLLIMQRTRILSRYATHHLICDLLAILVMLAVAASTNINLRYIKVLLLVKIPQLL